MILPPSPISSCRRTTCSWSSSLIELGKAIWRTFTVEDIQSSPLTALSPFIIYMGQFHGLFSSSYFLPLLFSSHNSHCRHLCRHLLYGSHNNSIAFSCLTPSLNHYWRNLQTLFDSTVSKWKDVRKMNETAQEGKTQGKPKLSIHSWSDPSPISSFWRSSYLKNLYSWLSIWNPSPFLFRYSLFYFVFHFRGTFIGWLRISFPYLSVCLSHCCASFLLFPD